MHFEHAFPQIFPIRNFWSDVSRYRKGVFCIQNLSWFYVRGVVQRSKSRHESPLQSAKLGRFIRHYQQGRRCNSFHVLGMCLVIAASQAPSCGSAGSSPASGRQRMIACLCKRKPFLTSCVFCVQFFLQQNEVSSTKWLANFIPPQ